jgi:hypothetical protein
MKRPPLKKCAKWACTLAAGAAVALAVFSAFYEGGLYWTPKQGPRIFGLWFDRGLLRALDNSRPGIRPTKHRWCRPQDYARWYWGWSEEMKRTDTAETEWHAGVMFETAPLFWKAGISLVYVVVLFGAPAAALWYADRRPRPGTCAECGYYRSGFTADAKCPECGAIPRT